MTPIFLPLPPPPEPSRMMNAYRMMNDDYFNKILEAIVISLAQFQYPTLNVTNPKSLLVDFTLIRRKRVDIVWITTPAKLPMISYVGTPTVRRKATLEHSSTSNMHTLYTLFTPNPPLSPQFYLGKRAPHLQWCDA